MKVVSGRWFWAAGFLVLFPLGVGLCLLSFMGVQSFGLSTPTDWSIEHPMRFAAGVVVIACALLSLRGYIVRLKSDLRASRERKADTPVTTQP